MNLMAGNCNAINTNVRFLVKTLRRPGYEATQKCIVIKPLQAPCCLLGRPLYIPSAKWIWSVLRTRTERTKIWVRERTKVIYYIHQCVKNEVVVDRAHQPPQRRSMGLACHHMETIRQENTTRETSQAVERRRGQILERHDLADDCAS